MSKRVDISSSRLLVASFAGAIAAGTLLLALPVMSQAPYHNLTFIEALFTSTSAVCVTGLTVRDLGSTFSGWGQVVVLLLIQAGGIGVLTFSNLFLIARQRRLPYHQRLLIEQAHGSLTRYSPAEIVRKVFSYTLASELLGAIVLSCRFAQDYPWPRALWLGVFHAVSAFCNAGFSLFSTSLEGYRDDWTVNVVIIVLIVLGGLGFIVFADLGYYLRGRLNGVRRMLTLHSRVVLLSSGILILGGTALFILLECVNPVMNQPWWGLAHNSLFLAVTSRTAGFNTVSIGQLTNPSLLILILLMLVGGSPGSTAGGAKTTTVAVLFALALARLRNRPQVEILNRSIPEDLVSKAVATFFGFGLIMTLGLILLQVFESAGLQHVAARSQTLDHLFEVVSALCTVGLSTGITASLAVPSQLTLVGLMFVGRLGPLLIGISLIGQRRRVEYTLPEEQVNIG
ncbi:hypothetical protein JW859_11635 [bacterium]|nr:hypothetical protein [bacterium]